MVSLFVSTLPLYAIDVLVRPNGFALFPMGEGNEARDGRERYEIGGGGGLGFDIDLASVLPNPLGLGYTAGIEGGMLMSALKEPASGNLQLYDAGAALGLYYFPLSRLFTGIDAGIGAFLGVTDTSKTAPGLWWRAGGGAGFRFTPGVTLALNAGYRQYQDPAEQGGVLMSGLYAGITARLTFELGEKTGGDGAAVTLTQDDGVYPALLSLYQTNPVGTITIRNNENAEIRDVRVSFRAGHYTASEFECGNTALIAKGRSATVDLFADFSSDLLQFTDSGRVLGEIVVRYSFLGKQKEVTAAASIEVYERGTVPQVNGDVLAAFVSPASQEVLEYAKNVTGQARNERRTGLNQTMQFAIWLFEGLRTYAPIVSSEELGVSSEEGAGPVSSTTNYSLLTTNSIAQFPSQTLAYKTGTARDWGLLYAATLEASGIGAAYIPLADGFIVAINLKINETQAAMLFNGYDKLLVIGEEVWLPVAMGSIGDSFPVAWDGAAAALNAAVDSGQTLELFTLAAAWEEYPPAPFPALGIAIEPAKPEALRTGAAAALDAYIASDIKPLIDGVTAEIKQKPEAALYNRLGILQIRAGNTAAARSAFQRGADMGSEAARKNLENLK